MQVGAGEWWARIKAIASGQDASIASSCGYVHTLGSTTTMCCLDHQVPQPSCAAIHTDPIQGVVSTAVPYLEKLLLPKMVISETGSRDMVINRAGVGVGVRLNRG